MATSLEKLVNNMSKDAFNSVRRYYVEDELYLLTRKGIYPYEYVDSPQKFPPAGRGVEFAGCRPAQW